MCCKFNIRIVADSKQIKQKVSSSVILSHHKVIHPHTNWVSILCSVTRFGKHLGNILKVFGHFLSKYVFVKIVNLLCKYLYAFTKLPCSKWPNIEKKFHLVPLILCYPLTIQSCSQWQAFEFLHPPVSSLLCTSIFHWVDKASPADGFPCHVTSFCVGMRQKVRKENAIFGRVTERKLSFILIRAEAEKHGIKS